MFVSCRWIVGLLIGLVIWMAPQAGTAAIRDGGIDPANLGKGDWIYIMPNAVNQLGGNVPAVTNLNSLMIFLKNQGLRYIIIKAGDDGTLFPSNAGPQFTPAVINAAHAAGLWAFGYNYGRGTNLPGEISIANYVFTNGADGFVYDAEIEWESQNLPNNTMLATQLCSTVRSNWPNKFIALSTWGYRAFHSSFPYKEFAYYCDAIMPQDYWIEFGDTATESVNTMNSQWRTWQNGLTGIWTNAIKPFAPTGQGWSSASGPINAAQITEFFNALKTVANPVTAGGYRGANFWRAELHPLQVWDAIRTNSIGNAPTGAPVIANVGVGAVSDTSVTLHWTTDQSSDSVVEHGLTTAYGSSVTNPTPIYYHTLTVTGLSPNTTYHYRAKSKNLANQTGVSADYVFTTLSVAVPEIVINDADTEASYTGTWTYATGNPGYNGDYHWGSSAASETRTATFRPTIATSGRYDVYVTFIRGGNRATNSLWTVSYSDGSTNVIVNQNGPANTSPGWVLLAAGRNFTAGTSGFVKLSNNTGASGVVVVADAVKFVYVPPPPAPPSIAMQPQPQTVNQGGTATFTVNASGTAPLAYQWRHAGTNLPGATASSYEKNNVQPADAGTYSVVVTNSVGSTNSVNATLTVNVPPSITAQPQSTNVNLGANVTFAVAATGTGPLSYQWRFNAADLGGATGSTYTKNDVQADDAGNYSVVVSNVAGIATSDDAVLTVTEPQAPHIDLITRLSDGRIYLQFGASPGRYGIEAATHLSPAPGDWAELTNFFTTTHTFEYLDSQTNLPQRFYRAKSLSP